MLISTAVKKATIRSCSISTWSGISGTKTMGCLKRSKNCRKNRIKCPFLHFQAVFDGGRYDLNETGTFQSGMIFPLVRGHGFRRAARSWQRWFRKYPCARCVPTIIKLDQLAGLIRCRFGAAWNISEIERRFFGGETVLCQFQVFVIEKLLTIALTLSAISS